MSRVVWGWDRDRWEAEKGDDTPAGARIRRAFPLIALAIGAVFMLLARLSDRSWMTAILVGVPIAAVLCVVFYLRNDSP